MALPRIRPSCLLVCWSSAGARALSGRGQGNGLQGWAPPSYPCTGLEYGGVHSYPVGESRAPRPEDTATPTDPPPHFLFLFIYLRKIVFISNIYVCTINKYYKIIDSMINEQQLFTIINISISFRFDRT